MYILDNVFLVMKDIVVENVTAFFGSVKVTGHYGKSANTYEINKPYLKYMYTPVYTVYIYIYFVFLFVIFVLILFGNI